jgi:putative Mg2+ transporter-C (MgtC) family protein
MDALTQFWHTVCCVEISTEQALFKLFVSMILGSIVGYERKRKGQPAGLRTFALISMGATMAMLVSIYVCQAYVGLKNGDPGRIAAQVITGVGFLGAGAIIQMKGSVRGLTTAAGIWMVSTIGLAVGVGLYLLSVVATLLVLIVLVILEEIEHRHEMGTESRIVRINLDTIVSDIEPYRQLFQQHKVNVVHIYFDFNYRDNTSLLRVIVLTKENVNFVPLFADLVKLNPTTSISFTNQLS